MSKFVKQNDIFKLKYRKLKKTDLTLQRLFLIIIFARTE